MGRRKDVFLEVIYDDLLSLGILVSTAVSGIIAAMILLLGSKFLLWIADFLGFSDSPLTILLDTTSGISSLILFVLYTIIGLGTMAKTTKDSLKKLFRSEWEKQINHNQDINDTENL